MSLFRIFFRTEWLTLTRSRLIYWLAGLLLITGLYAIFYGWTEVKRQQQTIALLHQDEQARLDTLYRHLSLDTTRAGNVQKWKDAHDPYFVDVEGYRYAIAYPGPLTAFSLGQRDLYPTYQEVMARASQRQLNPTELANPQKLLVGSFDLAFVLVYLLPLVLIVLGYNLLSAESEGGTLALLQTQAVSLRRVLGFRLLIRFGLVGVGIGVLIGLAALSNRVTDGERLMQWLAVSLIYAGFWTSLIWLVISFRRSSALNAVILLGAWLIVVLVMPALIQQLLADTCPLPDRAALQRIVREEYAKNTPIQQNLMRFYAHHPNLRDSDTTNAFRYNLMNYYARNEQLDQTVAPLVAQQESRISDRERAISVLRPLLPAVNALDLFNQLAGTDEPSRRDYLTQIARFHQTWKDFFVPLEFRGHVMTEADYVHIPTFTFSAPKPTSISGGIGWLMILTTTLVSIGNWQLQRR